MTAPTFEEMFRDAQSALYGARAALDQQIKRVGMIPTSSGITTNQGALLGAIEWYVQKAARVAVLETLQHEDFFVAMSRSAGAMQDAA